LIETGAVLIVVAQDLITVRRPPILIAARLIVGGRRHVALTQLAISRLQLALGSLVRHASPRPVFRVSALTWFGDKGWASGDGRAWSGDLRAQAYPKLQNLRGGRELLPAREASIVLGMVLASPSS
jgi:hypothetical protein